MAPADVRALTQLIQAQRTAQPAGFAETPFDIVAGGHERRADLEEERQFIGALAEAGATWWVEWIPLGGVEEMKRSIERGPLRAA